MGIDHCRLHAFMSEKLLNFADIGTLHQQMCGKAMAQRVQRGALVDTGSFHCQSASNFDPLSASKIDPPKGARNHARLVNLQL